MSAIKLNTLKTEAIKFIRTYAVIRPLYSGIKRKTNLKKSISTD